MAPLTKLILISNFGIILKFKLYLEDHPPSTGKLTPVIYDAESDNRKIAAFAISCGFAILP